MVLYDVCDDARASSTLISPWYQAHKHKRKNIEDNVIIRSVDKKEPICIMDIERRSHMEIGVSREIRKKPHLQVLE